MVPAANMQKFLGALWNMPGIDNGFCQLYWKATEAYNSSYQGFTIEDFMDCWTTG